jgi:hypothetical protein
MRHKIWRDIDIQGTQRAPYNFPINNANPTSFPINNPNPTISSRQYKPEPDHLPAV